MGRIIQGKKAKFEEYEDALFKARICIDGDPEDESIKETISVVCKKIPLSLYHQVIDFTSWAYLEKKSEAMLYFIYKQDPFNEGDGEWSLQCPEQWNSMVGVCAHPEIDATRFADAVGDVHSHPGMAWSGHSSIDDHDERSHNHGIYMVVSSPHDKPMTFWTTEITIYGYIRGRRLVIPPEAIFDMNSAPGNGGFPDAWKKLLHTDRCKICKDKPLQEEEKEETKGGKKGESRSSVHVRKYLSRFGSRPPSSSSGFDHYDRDKDHSDDLPPEGRIPRH